MEYLDQASILTCRIKIVNLARPREIAAAFFTTYEQLKAILPQLAPSLSSASAAPIIHMLASSGGEIAACMIRVPTEVVKSRQQTSKYGSSSNSLHAAKRVMAEAGIRGFYQGFGSTIAREVSILSACLQSVNLHN